MEANKHKFKYRVGEAARQINQLYYINNFNIPFLNI